MIKKYVSLLLLVTSFSFVYASSLSADMSDKRFLYVNSESLPKNCLEFLDKYFESYSVAHARFDGNYTVMLKGSITIKFDSKGNLKSVYASSIPVTSFIDNKILTYINKMYNNVSITYYGIKKDMYEIKLGNKKKLFFDSSFNFVKEK